MEELYLEDYTPQTMLTKPYPVKREIPNEITSKTVDRPPSRKDESFPGWAFRNVLQTPYRIGAMAMGMPTDIYRKVAPEWGVDPVMAQATG
jgi:hypothetical protein